jgi:hypothetical protein
MQHLSPSEMLPEVLRLRCASLLQDARSNLRPPRLNQRSPGKGKHSEPVHNPMSFVHCVHGVHGVLVVCTVCTGVLIASVHRFYIKCAQCARVCTKLFCFDNASFRLVFVHFQAFLVHSWCTLLMSTLLDMKYTQNVTSVLNIILKWEKVCIIIK